MRDSRALLIELLQHAYSGELAAALAYNGHWKSVRGESERDEIRKIETDELRHRALVGKILNDLGSQPDNRRERRMQRIGKIIGALCHVSGWFFPMYGAGRLERKNIGEYEIAARLAREAGLEEHVDNLLEMAEVEWDHEQYFRGKVLSHWLSRVFPIWSEPGGRSYIREAFENREKAPPSGREVHQVRF